MMACIGRNYSPLFTLIKHNTIVFDEVYILFQFNIMQVNGMMVISMFVFLCQSHYQ
jgi:hypothetical protein